MLDKEALAKTIAGVLFVLVVVGLLTFRKMAVRDMRSAGGPSGYMTSSMQKGEAQALYDTVQPLAEVIKAKGLGAEAEKTANEIKPPVGSSMDAKGLADALNQQIGPTYASAWTEAQVDKDGRTYVYGQFDRDIYYGIDVWKPKSDEPAMMLYFTHDAHVKKVVRHTPVEKVAREIASAVQLAGGPNEGAATTCSKTMANPMNDVSKRNLGEAVEKELGGSYSVITDRASQAQAINSPPAISKNTASQYLQVQRNGKVMVLYLDPTGRFADCRFRG